jgi:hypothetical protein
MSWLHFFNLIEGQPRKQAAFMAILWFTAATRDDGGAIFFHLSKVYGNMVNYVNIMDYLGVPLPELECAVIWNME